MPKQTLTATTQPAAPPPIFQGVEIKNKAGETDFTLMLGADPEFEVFREGRVILPGALSDIYFEVEGAGHVGLDGAQSVCEVRPLPDPDPKVIYERIFALMEGWEQHYTPRRVCLSGHTYAIGCHIHLGGRPGYSVRGALGDLVDAIDRVVGHLVNLSGVARGSYAERRVWRGQPHGVEYRTPPSAILALPELAISVFEAVQAVFRGRSWTWPEIAASAERKIRALLRLRVPFGLGAKPLVQPSAVTLYARDAFSAEVGLFLSKTIPKVIEAPVFFFGFAQNRGPAFWPEGLAQAYRTSGLPEFEGQAYFVDSVPQPFRGADIVVIGLPYNLRTLWSYEVIEKYMRPLINFLKQL